jgi:predicted transporter
MLTWSYFVEFGIILVLRRYYRSYMAIPMLASALSLIFIFLFTALLASANEVYEELAGIISLIALAIFVTLLLVKIGVFTRRAYIKSRLRNR